MSLNHNLKMKCHYMRRVNGAALPHARLHELSLVGQEESTPRLGVNKRSLCHSPFAVCVRTAPQLDNNNGLSSFHTPVQVICIETVVHLTY